MPRTSALALAALAAVLLALAPQASAQAAPPPAAAQAVSPLRPACAAPVGRSADCLLNVAPRAAADAAGLAPFTAADLQDAYNLPSARLGGGETVAVVVPFAHPNAGDDLAVYRRANGLPPCDADFPCFRVVNQRGGTEPPPVDATWSLNAAAGLQMAVAACPNCKLLLVTADDDNTTDLAQAVDQAAKQGATVITAAFGAYEYASTLADAVHYDHPGIPITAPSGNIGFPAQVGRQLVPAAYSTVTAVGGTALFRDGSARGWGEQAWKGSSSGCSVYVARPAWQSKGACGSKRTVADVAAVADINTPVAVYESFRNRGWVATAGTPISAALVAGIYALAGNGDLITPGRHAYANARQLFDVTTGSTGTCGSRELCNARPGYDGPTGLGTPNGIGAF